MDNLTHTLVGLMLARTGLGKTTPRGAAMLMLAANAPDIDGVTYFMGTQPYLEYHRGFTHTLLFMPVMAVLPMLLARARFSWRAHAAAMIAVLSHLIVDWITTYGISLLRPFSDHRFRLDIVTLQDLWVYAILIGAFAATMLFESAGIGKAGAARRGFAWAALLLFVAFGASRNVARNRAAEIMMAKTYEGMTPRRATALPNTAHPLIWRGVVEGDGFTALAPVDLTRGFEPGSARLYHSAPRSPAMEAALATPPFQVFTWFSQLPFAQEVAVPEGVLVRLIDLRFGTPDAPGFVTVTAIVDTSGKVLRAGFGF